MDRNTRIEAKLNDTEWVSRVVCIYGAQTEQELRDFAENEVDDEPEEVSEGDWYAAHAEHVRSMEGR